MVWLKLTFYRYRQTETLSVCSVQFDWTCIMGADLRATLTRRAGIVNGYKTIRVTPLIGRQNNIIYFQFIYYSLTGLQVYCIMYICTIRELGMESEGKMKRKQEASKGQAW